MIIITYFVTYFLSYLGYLLGNATVEEHKEIKKYIKYIVDILLIISYAMLLYTFKTSNILLLFLISLLLLIKIISHFHKKYFLDIHNVGLFSISLIFYHKNLYINEIYFTLFPLMILIFDNSMHKFNMNIEIIKFIFATALFLILYAI
jgi:hypothetical protein